jgi:hypothetical protein
MLVLYSPRRTLGRRGAERVYESGARLEAPLADDGRMERMHRVGVDRESTLAAPILRALNRILEGDFRRILRGEVEALCEPGDDVRRPEHRGSRRVRCRFGFAATCGGDHCDSSYGNCSSCPQ